MWAAAFGFGTKVLDTVSNLWAQGKLAVGLVILMLAAQAAQAVGTKIYVDQKHKAGMAKIQSNSGEIHKVIDSQKALEKSQTELNTTVKVMAESVKNMADSVRDLKKSVQDTQDANLRTQEQLVRIYREQVDLLRGQTRNGS